MKNLFKYIIIFLVVLVMGSCNMRNNGAQRDAESSNALCGEWIGHPFGPGPTEHIDFNENGTAKVWYVGDKGQGDSFQVTYEMKSGQIHITCDGETSIEYTFDGSELVSKTGVVYTKITR